MKILSIDLGGTSAKIGLVEGTKIIKRWEVSTDIDNLFGNIKDNLTDVNWDEIDGIGLSIPGFIDHKNSIVTLAGNLNLNNYHVKDEFKKIFGKEAFVVNDANAATLGEHWVGAGKGVSSMLLYTIGTGIGGGVIIDNKLVYGQNGWAGEFGHAGNMQSKYDCSCGLKNCVEASSSATGIQKELKESLGKEVTIKDVAQEFANGDKRVTAAFTNALKPLASHIAIMETALNPEMIVIGGGPSQLGEPLRRHIEDLVGEVQLEFLHKNTKLVLAETRNDAGMYGAAYWAIQNIKGEI